MKIKEILVYLKKLPLTKSYTIAYQTFEDVELVFIEIILENGIVGIGSASPAEEVVGESSKQAFKNLNSSFFQDFIGKDIRLFNDLIYQTKQNFQNYAGTRAAIDIALHDAFCKYLGVSVAKFYGQKVDFLPTSVTIGIMNKEETLKNANEYINLGFRVFKVKTGINIEEDIERMIKLRETFGNSITLRADANQGYSMAELIAFYHSTKNLGIELIEQPIKVGKELDLIDLDISIRQLLVADESLHDAETAIKYTNDPKPFGIFNIKLMKCGGILAAKEIADIAQNSNTDLFWGCNDESIISITAALHIAYCSKMTKYLDLDGSFDLAYDLVKGGFEIKDGLMKINNKPGLGLTKL